MRRIRPTPSSLTARCRRLFEKVWLRARLAWLVLTTFEDVHQRSGLRLSFSQDGEDLIAWRLLSYLGITRPRYLDIGAHHPDHLSNTALFYWLGGSGINIEPDPDLYAEFIRRRKRDLNLNLGIASEPGVLSFHRMEDPSLNTFSSVEAERLATEQGVSVRERIPVEVDTIRNVLASRTFRPDFLTIDVEGMELEILKSIDWDSHRPGVICAEVCAYSRSGRGPRNEALVEYLLGLGYVLAAETSVNAIFVDWTYRAPAGRSPVGAHASIES